MAGGAVRPASGRWRVAMALVLVLAFVMSAAGSPARWRRRRSRYGAARTG
ncbi:MAG: hypothetical protein U0841_33310 [Chloroflexia bacterium]